MNKKTVATAGTVIVALGFAIGFHTLSTQTVDRFPHLDPKTCRKAFRRLMFKAVSGQYEQNLDDYDDAAMDELFLEEYNYLTAK